MQRHDVRKRFLKQGVISGGHHLYCRGEIFAFCRRHIGQSLKVSSRHNVDFVGPSRGKRDESGESLILHHETCFRSSFGFQNRAKKTSSSSLNVSIGCIDLLLYPGRDEWISVELAVRMMKGDSYRLTLVFKNEDVVHKGQLLQLQPTRRPDKN